LNEALEEEEEDENNEETNMDVDGEQNGDDEENSNTVNIPPPDDPGSMEVEGENSSANPSSSATKETQTPAELKNQLASKLRKATLQKLKQKIAAIRAARKQRYESDYRNHPERYHHSATFLKQPPVDAHFRPSVGYLVFTINNLKCVTDWIKMKSDRVSSGRHSIHGASGYGNSGSRSSNFFSQTQSLSQHECSNYANKEHYMKTKIGEMAEFLTSIKIFFSLHMKASKSCLYARMRGRVEKLQHQGLQENTAKVAQIFRNSRP
jgi:hypothetical protein